MVQTEYESILQRIEQARDVPAKEVSFARVQNAFRELDFDLPIDGKGVILIAGTNGKGTVAKTLETLLREKEPKVGLFTSPHLMSTTERIRSHGRDLSEQEFVAAFRLVEPLVNKYGLSHFEILTLMMAEVFFSGRVRERVNLAVIEVGVGGRLDPTRCVPHATSVITGIALDHQEILGRSLQAIAREKFGIVEQGNLVIHGRLPPEVSSEIARVCETTKSDWVEAPSYAFRVDESGAEPKWILQTPFGEAPLALAGARAAANTSLALTVLDQLDYDVSSLLNSVSIVRWPCRMELFNIQGRRVYLSGDHNVQGAESLREILEHHRYQTVRLVVGIGKNKSADELLSVFAEVPRHAIYLTVTPFRAADIQSYGSWLERAEAADVDAKKILLQAINDCSEGDIVVVTGSLYLTGHLRKLIVENFLSC